MKNARVISTALCAAVLSAFAAAPSIAGDGASAVAEFDSKGDLIRPTGYRTWVYVGTPLTPNDMNDGKAAFPEFHNVYIDPASYEIWEETGTFRDGTVIIKELVSVGSKAAVSGQGYFMGDFIGLEATIKNAERFPDEPGNWAYFSFTTPDHSSLTPTATAFPTQACAACHAASAADDMVFTQYYPVLRASKPTMTSSLANSSMLNDLQTLQSAGITGGDAGQ